MKDPRVRQKSSLSHKGKKLSEEQKRKMSLALKGRTVAEDVKRRVSESVKKLWQDPEYRARNLAGCKTRPVGAYDRDGNLVFQFSSLTEADDATGVDFRNIQAVCKGRRKIAGGYVWKYIDEQANTEVNAETKESA